MASRCRIVKRNFCQSIVITSITGATIIKIFSSYIHLNPVKAGFVKCPAEWEFSSYLEYVKLRQGTLPELGKIRQIVGTVQAYQAAIAADSPLQPQLQRLLLD